MSKPFGRELKRLGVPHRFYSTPVNQSYRTRFGLLCRIYPTLIFWATISSIRSLLFSKPNPAAVVVTSEIEALIFGCVRTLLRRRTLVVLPTLIITPSQSKLANMLYMFYWRMVIAVIDIGICHSRAEISSYNKLFRSSKGKLLYIPFGLTLEARTALLTTPPLGDGLPVVVTAGRSGRDYRTLVEAIKGLPCRLKIVCDLDAPLSDIAQSDQIDIVRDCFGSDYLRMLAGASFVVIPLAADNVSSGQMVLLQSFALHRAVIITRTATTVDYATDKETALFVPRADIPALRSAVIRLLEDPDLRMQLGCAGALRFDQEYSAESYARSLVAALTSRIRGNTTGIEADCS
ncbi:MAG TPA: glycosyltransferase family 4 protein [Acetobacteraceae bacterium]|nr:glycosyltransferase family 4 protein [Acetobacteraceae bacterium]